MPYTVWGGFDKFQKDVIDLAPDQVRRARASRDYLSDQLKACSIRDASFPRVTEDALPYGSFARSTKVCPLDDVDMLMIVSGGGTREEEKWGLTGECRLRITNSDAALAAFEDEEDEDYVNSTRILYRVRNQLSLVPSYSKADIHKNMQAVKLKLLSYTWSFDIVPAVPIGDASGNRLYFLIPNGYGDWLRTDPRRDKRRLSTMSGWHNNKLRPVLRLLKYWNARPYS
jgi:hypothetical protein